MKPDFRAVLLCLAFAATATPLQAYEFETHRNFSLEAASASKLSDAQVLYGLGLRRPITADSQLFPSSRGAFLSVQIGRAHV